MVQMVELVVLSLAFTNGAVLPLSFSGVGENTSPPLSWSAVPEGTQSIAILCDDPDAPAGDWVHWVLFNLPADMRELPAHVPPTPQLPNGALQGYNDYNRHGYYGPTPPPGQRHRYFFKVFALNSKLNLTAQARKADLLKAMQGHILAQGQLMATFAR